MQPPPAPSSAAPTSFQPASTLPRAPAAGPSNRDASGGLPPIRPDPPAAAGPSSSSSTSAAGASGAADAATGVPPASKNAIVYNAVQRRNPLLLGIKNVGIEIGDIVADYQVGAHNGVLFLSLKYHRLHPEYIHQRIEKMRGSYNVRIMLVLCDIHQESLRELAKVAIINAFTVFVAWSNEEAAQYLTTFKAYEHKSADTLKERVHQTYPHQLEHVLTSGRKVNKSDTEALAAAFGSFANMTAQSNHALGNVKGLGPVKVVSLLDAFNKPFVVGGLAKRRGQATGPANADGTSGARATLAAAEPAAAGPASAAREEHGAGPAARQARDSPDWSDDEPAPAAAAAAAPGEGRQRARAPSRSPSPGAVWSDPLADDGDDDDGGLDGGGAVDGSDGDGLAAKRRRT